MCGEAVFNAYFGSRKKLHHLKRTLSAARRNLQAFECVCRRTVHSRVVSERSATEIDGHDFFRDIQARINIRAQRCEQRLPFRRNTAPENDRLRAENIYQIGDPLAQRSDVCI